MRLLLDTHALLRVVTGDARLSSTARALYLTPESDLYVSIASLWEIAIKVSIGKLTLCEGWQEAIQREMTNNGILWLPITPAHCTRVAALPFHHRDPFDRLLIAQATQERMSILSADGQFPAYGVDVC